jgi:microsomal dipeptidase-like Zn-dependent dipeptidase
MNETVTVAEIADHIRKVGVESTVLSTDFGQEANPSPVEGFQAYLSKLAAEGFQEMELRRMAGENPTYLLDL